MNRKAGGTVLFFSLVGAACVEAPRPPPVTPRPDASPAAVATPPPLAARWVRGGGATAVGPAVSGGTMVLLGGRRALVKGDGAVRPETVSAPEPLLDLLEVPTASGPRLVGHGMRGVYRFDDPLGAPVVLARSDDRIDRIGAGPGLVAVWIARSDLPRFLELDTGRQREWKGLPAPPLRALAFVDPRRGAGIFEAVGLAITADAGATWKVAAPSRAGDGLHVTGLRRRGGGTLRAFGHADGPDGAVELAGAALGPLELATPPAGEPPLLRWIRVTRRDPLEAAATGGLDLPSGGALVASHGLLGRVDLAAGALVDLVAFAEGKWVGPCGSGRSGPTGWIACTLSDEHKGSVYDPFGVLKLVLGDRTPAPDRPVLMRNGEAELRVSPSGGAMLLKPCSNEETGDACVRQPDGAWKTIAGNVDLDERGAGPLADGRVAFLRGISENDVAEEIPGPQPGPAGGPREAPPARGLHVAVLGPNGKEQPLAAVGFVPSRGYVRAQSPIEEDADHVLRFVIEDGEGPFAVSVPPGREPAQVQRIAGAVAARMHAGRGIAVGEGRVLASLDGGGTWHEVPASAAVLDAASLVAASYEEPGQLVVSDAGAKVGTMLRLGWGPPEAAPAAPAAEPAPGQTLEAPSLPAAGPERTLVCTGEGAAQGVPPLLGTAEIRSLLAGKPPAAPGTRRESSTWSQGRAGMLETVALFEEEGPEARESKPATWSLRWHDPREIGGRVRSFRGPVPKGAPWGANLRFAAAAGGRALFAMRSGGKFVLVRIKPSGAAETIEVPAERVPSGEVVFGEGRGEPIAWLHETEVIVWRAGEKPRAIASLSTHPVRALGVPGDDGVPLMVGSSDWTLLRVLPVPAVDKAAPDKAPAVAMLDGWSKLRPLRSELGAMPACGAKAKGARFSLPRLALKAQIDGVDEGGSQAFYEVRIDGGEACVAGIVAAVGPERRGRGAPAGKGKAAAPRGPAAFVRVDLAGKRAEGGDRGGGAAVRRMRCALGGKP
jgi:hypothetical protein